MNNQEKADSIKKILNTEIPGLHLEYVSEEETTDPELIINNYFTVQFCPDGSYWLGFWDGETLSPFGTTYQRYDIVDFVKNNIEKAQLFKYF